MVLEGLYRLPRLQHQGHKNTFQNLKIFLKKSFVSGMRSLAVSDEGIFSADGALITMSFSLMGKKLTPTISQ